MTGTSGGASSGTVAGVEHAFNALRSETRPSRADLIDAARLTAMHPLPVHTSRIDHARRIPRLWHSASASSMMVSVAGLGISVHGATSNSRPKNGHVPTRYCTGSCWDARARAFPRVGVEVGQSHRRVLVGGKAGNHAAQAGHEDQVVSPDRRACHRRAAASVQWLRCASAAATKPASAI